MEKTADKRPEDAGKADRDALGCAKDERDLSPLVEAAKGLLRLHGPFGKKDVLEWRVRLRLPPVSAERDFPVIHDAVQTEKIFFSGGWGIGAREVCRQVMLGNGLDASVRKLAESVLALNLSEGEP